MVKAATKKNQRISKVVEPKTLPARKPARTTPAKQTKVGKASIAKKAVAKTSTVAKKTRATRAPVITKDELRAQIEKLTAANVTLKTKGRETAKALKVAEGRVAVLEDQISQTEAK